MKLFYPKFALDAIRKNRKIYFPFILTYALVVAMYNIIYTLKVTQALNGTLGDTTIGILLGFGTIVIGVFSVIFLFYTSSFIMKSRRQEFGLYSVLGMGKRHITLILFYETILASGVGILVGLAVASLLNWAAFLWLLKMLGADPTTPFSLSMDAIISTILLYLGISLCIFLWNTLGLWRSGTITLMNSTKEGEKEPKAKWVLAILGLMLLAAGYVMAVKIKNPVGAMVLFFVAVILVILGTYLLFTAGSIAFLKLLKKSKGYYYKTNHFISVSGMLYRMKQNAVSLGNICILSTMVLVTLSTTTGLYAGCADMIAANYPRTLNLHMYSASETPKTNLWVMAETENLIFTHGGTPENGISCTYLSIGGMRDGNTIVTDLSQKSTMDELTNVIEFTAISVSDYNRLSGNHETLETGDILLYTSEGYYEDRLYILGQSYRIKKTLDSVPYSGIFTSSSVADMIAVVPDDQIHTLYVLQKEVYGQYASELCCYYGCDVADDEIAKQVSDEFDMHMADNLQNCDADEEYEYCRFLMRNRNEQGEFVYQIYGGMLFIGVFLGVLFLIATILIIYYKQLSEGLSDRKRFGIMQKVGLSRRDIRKSIHSQVLTMFFMPLIVAFVHCSFAFPMIHRCLKLLNMPESNVFAWAMLVCCGVFALAYFIVYTVTSNVYYSIVGD